MFYILEKQINFKFKTIKGAQQQNIIFTCNILNLTQKPIKKNYTQEKKKLNEPKKKTLSIKSHAILFI